MVTAVRHWRQTALTPRSPHTTYVFFPAPPEELLIMQPAVCLHAVEQTAT